MGGGGGGGGVVGDIANGISKIPVFGAGVSGLQGLFHGGIGGAAKGIQNNLTGQNLMPDRPGQPQAPGVDSGVDAMHQAQLDQARNFRANLGQNEQGAFENFSKAQNQSMGKNLNAVNQANSARGLLYGGVNQGQQQAVRAQGQTQLAQGRASINDQYNQAANQMDASAVGSGVAVQQYQQGIQDQIYNQALMNMMNQNQAFGSLMGAGAMGTAMALA